MTKTFVDSATTQPSETPSPSHTKRQVLILQRPKQKPVTPLQPASTKTRSHQAQQSASTRRTCCYCQSQVPYRHILSHLPVCDLDLTPPTPQIAVKLALCRHRLVLTRDDISLPGQSPINASFRNSKGGRTIETMSSDSTTASDFDACPIQDIPSAPSIADAIFLLERCSVVSSEITNSATSPGAFLTVTGNDVLLLKECMSESLSESTHSPSPSRLRVKLGPSSDTRGPLHVFVHRPACTEDRSTRNASVALLSDWRRQLRASLSILSAKRRLVRFLCDQDEHFQLSDDHLELKRFISDFLRSSTCVDVLVEVSNGVGIAIAIRIRTGEVPPSSLADKKTQRSKWVINRNRNPGRTGIDSRDDSSVSPELSYLAEAETGGLDGFDCNTGVSSCSRSSSSHSPPIGSSTSSLGGEQTQPHPNAQHRLPSLSPGRSDLDTAPPGTIRVDWNNMEAYDMVLDETCPMRPALAAYKSAASPQGFTPSFITVSPRCDFPFHPFSPELPHWDKYYWEGSRMESQDYYTPWAPGSHSQHQLRHDQTTPEKRFPNISFSIGPCDIANDILCCFWDLESTGLRVASDQVIQIGCTLRVFHTPTEDKALSYFSLLPGLSEAQHDFSLYVTTDLEIPEEISELTNITNQLLNTQGVDLASALRLWHNWIDDLRMQLISSTNRPCELWMVAHNGNQFDIPLLFLHELQRLSCSPGTIFKQMGVDAIVDSVVLSRALFFAEQELDGQKMARVVSRSHRLSDLYWNSFHELMPNQHNALYDAKAVSMVMSQEPFLHAWRHEAVAWRLGEYVSAWHRAYGALNRRHGFENVINRLLSETAASLPTRLECVSSPPVLPKHTTPSSPSNHSSAIWRSFRQRSKQQEASLET